MNSSFRKIFILLTSVFFLSCNSYKDLIYLNDINEKDSAYLSEIGSVHEPKIRPNDILSISVISEIRGAAEDFNLPLLAVGSESDVQVVGASRNSSGTLQNYLVDKDGKIDFPVLGSLTLKDMTVTEAQEYIQNAIYPEYIYTKPIVNIRQLNFTISVLGEVNKPGTYKADNGQITIFDALAAAGDMTIFGKRDNILLMRTQNNGKLTFHRIDIRNKNTVLNKNIYYLQQNDKLYVQANKAKGNSSSFGTMQTVGISALSVIISVIAIIAAR